MEEYKLDLRGSGCGEWRRVVYTGMNVSFFFYLGNVLISEELEAVK